MKIKLIFFSIFIFLFLFLFNNCSSSKKAELKTEKTVKFDSFKLSRETSSSAYKDSIIVFSFYRIMDKDTLKLKSVIVSNKDSLMQQLKIPEVAWRAGLKGNVIINFDLDSSGIANNIRILSGIGGGTEQAVISTIAKFKFDISQDYLPINSKSISILLIAYFEFKPPLVKINVY